MEKLIFKKEGQFNTYKLKKEVLTKESLRTIYYLGNFLQSYVFIRPEFFLDWLITSDTEYDIRGCDGYNLYRLEDQTILVVAEESLDEAQEASKYIVPYAEMIKILKTWSELIKDKNSPTYLTIVENNKTFTLITSNETPEELK